MALVKIEYPNGGGFEVEGDTEESTVALAYFAIATLWGRKTMTDSRKYGDNPVTLDEIDAWLGK